MSTAQVNSTISTANRKTYAGVFIVTLATLLLELLLTRIWSVTMWYHFAFVAVSLAMFGMTAGALIVYLNPNFFHPEKTNEHLGLSALLFSISTIVCFLSHLTMPFMPDRSLSGLYAMALSYLTVSLPFLFSGIVVTLVLTRFPKQINSLYAADLAGAALGCAMFTMILNITDGPTAILFTAYLASIAAILLAHDKRKKLAVIVSLFIGCLTVANAFSVQIHQPLVRLLWVKANFEGRPHFEKWNSFSRITIDGDPNKWFAPANWGLSDKLNTKPHVKEMQLLVDSLYATAIPGFTGNMNDTEYLKFNVSFLAHYLRPNAKVLVIGVGGGRDILAALAFNQKSITGVEINNIFTEILQKTFADFSGHFIEDPRVTLVNDEARSFTSRQKDKFNIIQLTFINTGTATGAGAFALSEHSLYTQEAWQMFLNRLTDNGLLTCTRNYFIDESGHPLPGELHRLISLARSALEHNGISEPENHIACVSWSPDPATGQTIGVVTLLVSKQPFSKEDLATLGQVVKEKDFAFLIAPKITTDPILKTLASGQGLEALAENFPTRIDAPTDDRPFFFYVLRTPHLFNIKASEVGTYQMYTKAMEILFELLVVVIFLCAACFLLPLIITNKQLRIRRDLPLLLFFAAVGFGFMFIEVSQLQRLVIFLGHPSYSLSVVLFSLLVSSSIGSLLVTGRDNSVQLILRLVLLLAVLIAYAFISPQIIQALSFSEMPQRFVASVAMLFPIGLFMGMCVPLGLQLAYGKSPAITPWLWGINGATSVCASVLTVVVSINYGLSASYWTGAACYLVAFLSFLWASRLPATAE